MGPTRATAAMARDAKLATPFVRKRTEIQWWSKRSEESAPYRKRDIREEVKVLMVRAGDKNPLTVTSEKWISPELQVTVYSKQSDPRSGDSIYRLANVKRTDQPLSLFSVPADYATRDGHNIGTPAPKAGPPIK